MSNKKIVFCGCGPMGEGILGGLLNNNVAKAKDVTVNELLEVRRTYIAETYGVAAIENASDALRAADLVIIAVNPAQMPKVAQTIRPLIKKACIVMSIACGVSLGTLAGMLGDDKKILRVMPNTLIKSGNGYSAACVNPNIDEEDKKLITAVLNALGQTMYVTEDMFETFTAFCCTGPIWLYKMVEALVDAGVYAGFSRDVCGQLHQGLYQGQSGLLLLLRQIHRLRVRLVHQSDADLLYPRHARRFRRDGAPAL